MAAMLPPPVPASNETSSSSSSRKRNRSDIDSANESSTSSTSLFSRRTKQKIVERNNGGRCWHCGGGAPDIAHVISKKDGSFSKYVAWGLLTFDHLGDEQNGLPLCPSCHRAFDDINNPGLIFIPTHLEYFIDFELKDYNNRLDVARRLSHVPPRIVPTPQMYADYLQGRQILSPETKGGSYWRYTLRDFFPVNADKSFIPGLGPFKEPGSWCGAPMAALRRAFQVISDPTIEGIPEDQLEQLWQLRRLYARKDPQIHLVESHTAEQNAARMITSSGEAAAQVPTSSTATSAPAQFITDSFVDDRGRRNNLVTSGASSQRMISTKSTITSMIFCEAKSPQLRKFGRGASTEINIQRYLTMLKS
ncbi:uncharacterized protein A1O9_13101 [Exophiala aquamarina CBS 119918]|uniref:HNH nuclease domain-containing protein n=1 Tax=Exophiala aquamarina CBS 119918 TaxID=1182545 RepID=A0A072P5F8_9EURO|nr:uncharacterized protein A1O9_13101 [Exophiala aquamarina CBS 119918]KEF50845.1 hypothetical protein A1O9_13101 [Exophiala aquamarina CBS 119918]